MADMERQVQYGNRARVDEGIDQGLRSYMLSVYNYMAVGLLITGVAAYGMYSAMVGNPELAQTLFGSPLKWVVMLAPLAFVMVLSFGIHKMSVSTAQLVFWTYAAVMGVSISWILLVFTGESVVRTFFITAASFGALSLYGYTTKRDLSGMGSFLFMGLIGLILASVVNLFLQSSAMQFAISVIGVLIFAGLTAYDTQRIKEMYFEGDGALAQGRKAIMGALSLYLNFVNMFMFLLQFLGNRE
ncbi:MAG: Bax inhibitor-1/YccA family protein [Pseudomonadota bacterium]